MAIKIGLVGTGTVGAGCLDILAAHKEDFKRHYGVDFEVAGVCSLEPEVADEYGYSDVFTTDFNDIITNPEIDIVIELIGGTTFAKTVIEGAIANGKHVVTANKALVATKEGAEHSDMLIYELEEDEYYRLVPYKKIFGHSIRANEKDINDTQTQRIDVYENTYANYPLWIRGKYLNTCAKYAFVNADFINNPITANLIQVEGKYPYIAGMTVPEQVNTEITEYVDAPYIAITVIEQGGGVSIPYAERFNLYTTNPDAEIIYEEAIPAKTITSKKINNDTGAVAESWGTMDMVLYNNTVENIPYMIKGEHMINNAAMYAFVNEDFYNNPVTENIISVSKDKYPYKADQIAPIYYETPIGEGDINKTAPYIAICVSINSNIAVENRLKLYMKKNKNTLSD